jgi:hypothetical protein
MQDDHNDPLAGDGSTDPSALGFDDTASGARYPAGADALPHRVARQAFPLTRVPSAPGLGRRPTEVSAATAAARQLFAQVNPAVPASYGRVLHQPLRPFFPPALLAPTADHVPLGFTLGETVTNGWPLYVQGSALGVGASILAAEYAKQFNYAAHAEGDPRRVAYADILSEMRSVRHVLDALALALEAPLRNVELRFRGTPFLGRRVHATAAQGRVVMIVIDHVHRLEGEGRKAVASILRVFDPRYHVPLHGDPTRPPAPRVAIVLVDHKPPADLFAAHPDALGLLQGRHVVLQPYTTVEQVGQALELADIGVASGSFDPTDDDDRAMAERILELTSGLVIQMDPLLTRLGALARHVGTRPNATLVDAVLPYHQQMLELVERLGEGPNGREYQTRVIRPRRGNRPWLPAGASDAEHDKAAREAAAARRAAADGAVGAQDTQDDRPETEAQRDVGEGAGRDRPGTRPPRVRALRAKRDEHAKTERVARKLNRRGHTNP